MGFIRGEGRRQGTLFPVILDDMIPVDHACRVIDAFVDCLAMGDLGFARAEPEETGRPGYDPRDLLKLYLYGYLQQMRSSRRLEAECRRNIELMWLLGRLEPDHKSIAEFRRLHREAIAQAGAELVGCARQAGLIGGEWVAIDGSKFRAASSANSVGARVALERWLDAVETGDRQDEIPAEREAVAAAQKKLESHAEPEARFMRSPGGYMPAYNVQTAVDAEHALIVAQQVTTEATDNRSLQPMAEAAQAAIAAPGEPIHILADAGYSNGEQAQACEEQGLLPHVPANRAANSQGDGTLFNRSEFIYDEKTDTFRCPAGQRLERKQLKREKNRVVYAGTPEVCRACPLRTRCTNAKQRVVHRHLYDGALERMQQRATPEAMRLRRSTVEHPFATLKYRIFGHPRFLLRGLAGAQTEISLATMAYNLKRMIGVLGGAELRAALA